VAVLLEQTLTEQHLILGLGELLWDVLPEGERLGGVPIDGSLSKGHLGGAPSNFAVMAGRLGDHAAILSRIGRDDLGRRAVDTLDPQPVDASHVQVDSHHATGRVTVTLEDGQPRFTIHEPAAWDFLELTDQWVSLAERADAICFGSLAQRCLESRQTIQTLAAQTSSKCVRLFDVNLRAPFYSGEVIQESLELATVMKMSDAEAPLILGMLGLPAAGGSPQEQLRIGAERLLDEFPTLRMVAVTRGAHGSLLVTREEWHEHPGFPVTVVDTIGAGDAFTAALAHYLLQGADLATLNEAGNLWGSWVASQAGGMPAVPDEVLAGMMESVER
jgi:fructokinase